MKKFDVIIIGGGHNGLVAACVLSKKGKKVLVIEKNEKLGGLANYAESLSYISKEVIDELNIKTIGDLFYVSYNSPYKVFNRRNEVMVEIEYED